VVRVMRHRARVLLIPPFLQAFIVFFNNRDLCVAKLARVSADEEGALTLDAPFPDCPPAAAAGDLEEAEDFVIEKYVSQSRSNPPGRGPEQSNDTFSPRNGRNFRSIYTHLTTATDTQIIEKVRRVAYVDLPIFMFLFRCFTTSPRSS